MFVMKKWLFLFLICLRHLSFASPVQDRTIDPVALAQLAATLGIPPDTDIIAETQKRWLRKPGLERWEVAELPTDQKLFVLKWAREQGLFSPWKPLLKTYDKALILGATTSSMQRRLHYLAQLWEEGIRFSEVVWLTGHRPLDQRVDGLIDRCSNESEAAHLLWEEASLPEEMRNLPVVFVAVPMKIEGSSLVRPNTQDTFIAWLKIAPEPCKALLVSDQPYCGYQFAVVKTILPDSFLFDLVGPAVDLTKRPTTAAVALDSIARWIYQESLRCAP